MKAIKITVVLLVIGISLAGCSLFRADPPEIYLVLEEQTGKTVSGHPEGEGLRVGLQSSEPVAIAWGDGDTNNSETYYEHVYERAGSMTVTATNGKGATATATVIVENEAPEMGDTLLLASGVLCEEPIAVWLNPHVHGCDRGTGCFLYQAGITDPEGDEIRVRVDAAVVQAYVDGEEEIKEYKRVQKVSVFSLHDRSYISGQWRDILGFWLTAGWSKVTPPYPFSTVPHTSLEPRFEPQWIWDCPGCGDDPPEEDPETPEEPGLTASDCYLEITVRVVDKWGGYNGKAWRYLMNTCNCDTCSSASEGGYNLPCH
jgi:hypothetical protein